MKCGLAIKPNTSWIEIQPYLNLIDQVTVMTVEPRAFMEDQIIKIKKISNHLKSNNLNVEIEIDGGVNFETGREAKFYKTFLFNQGDLIKATN